MLTIKYLGVIIVFIALTACNHSKPKPVSQDITKTTVTINGKKDSVINNPEKNYGNATVSEPCVKCFISVIQNAASYKELTSSLLQTAIIFDINWITSSKPVNAGTGIRIVNGVSIDVIQKAGSAKNKLASYIYNNKNAKIYQQNGPGHFVESVTVGDSNLKKIRNSCFWGVASSK